MSIDPDFTRIKTIYQHKNVNTSLCCRHGQYQQQHAPLGGSKFKPMYSVWTLRVLPVSVWVLSGFSVPLSKDMH